MDSFDVETAPVKSPVSGSERPRAWLRFERGGPGDLECSGVGPACHIGWWWSLHLCPRLPHVLHIAGCHGPSPSRRTTSRSVGRRRPTPTPVRTWTAGVSPALALNARTQRCASLWHDDSVFHAATCTPAGTGDCPEARAGWASRLLFAWVDPLLEQALRRPLAAEDLWATLPRDAAQAQAKAFRWHLASTVVPGSRPQVLLRAKTGGTVTGSPHPSRGRAGEEGRVFGMDKPFDFPWHDYAGPATMFGMPAPPPVGVPNNLPPQKTAVDEACTDSFRATPASSALPGHSLPIPCRALSHGRFGLPTSWTCSGRAPSSWCMTACCW